MPFDRKQEHSPEDDFLSDRFGEFNSALLATEILKHDLEKVNLSEDAEYVVKNLRFSEKLPPKVVLILERLIPHILKFAQGHHLKLRGTEHYIRFQDKASYENEINRPFPASVPLPASKIQYNALYGVYLVTVILPDQLHSLEQVINVTRTLFSKLMGDIYLNESILSLEFYRESTIQNETQRSTGIVDQVNLILGNEFKSDLLNHYCNLYAKRQHLNLKKQYSLVKKELVAQWLEKWQKQTISGQEIQDINSIFREFLEHFRLHPESSLEALVAVIEALNAHLHFILPHETKAYALFSKENLQQYLQAASNKLQELKALIGFIEEVTAQLEDLAEPEILAPLYEQIQLNLKQLQKERKVTVFLVPGLTLGPKLEQEKQNFPLVLMKLLPKTLPVNEWHKTVQKWTKYYESSIYQKIFEAFVYLKHWIEAYDQNQHNAFPETVDYKRLKQLLNNLNYRLPSILQTLLTLETLLDYNQSFKKQASPQQFPVEAFKKAWSYFISSILIHFYYQQQSQVSQAKQKFNTQKYLQTVEKYTLYQMRKGVNYFHIVYLFIRIYQSKPENERISYLLYMLQHPQRALKYVMGQIMETSSQVPLSEELLRKRIEKIINYQDLLLQVFDERLREDILPGRDYPNDNS
ncbi:hypothetical protein WDW89_03565 [Deltaproteobacteria bacterium TL4]